MGYTHYFTIKDWTSPEWQAAWPQLLKDVPSIIEEANIPLAGREDDDEPVIDEDEGIWLNGVEDMGHETLVICEEEAGGFQFVKTARKPYDEVVACILLRAYMLAPKAFELRSAQADIHSSDGEWEEEWELTRDLYTRLWPDAQFSCPWEGRD